MRFIGIDPGLDGAAAALTGDGAAIRLLDTPTLTLEGRAGKHREYDLHAMAEWLRESAAGADRVVALMEKVHAMPEQGVSSSFNFGVGFGAWRGLLVGVGIAYELVTPQRWKAAMLADRLKDKDAARLKAMELWPSAAAEFRLKKHDGRAEAALIAEHARRTRG